ncbi:hypothetical protein Tco_1472703, partial [Tanacetum coccineum]
KPAKNEGFEQIVDFLNAHTIKYALTIDPIIYLSCIEQFWTTAKVKTVNGKVQLQAPVDGKKIITTESIVRRDLQLKNAEGVDSDEAVNEEMDDSFVRAATAASSLEAEQDSGNINKTRSKATLNEPNPQGTGSVKKLEKKGGSRTHKLKILYKVGRSARVISSDEASLGDQEDASKQGRKIDDIDKDTEITLVDETQGRYGDDLMFDTCVLDDKEVFSGQDMAEKEINVVEKEVSTADPVTTASVEISTASLIETIIADDLTLAQTLIEIRSAKPKVKGVVIE